MRDADVGHVSRQARCHRLCNVLLLASPTQTGPTFTWRWVSGYVGPRFCDVTCGLLQLHSRWGVKVHHRQAPASSECYRSRRRSIYFIIFHAYMLTRWNKIKLNKRFLRISATIDINAAKLLLPTTSHRLSALTSRRRHEACFDSQTRWRRIGQFT